jgi:hypothetical protein
VLLGQGRITPGDKPCIGNVRLWVVGSELKDLPEGFMSFCLPLGGYQCPRQVDGRTEIGGLFARDELQVLDGL